MEDKQFFYLYITKDDVEIFYKSTDMNVILQHLAENKAYDDWTISPNPVNGDDEDYEEL